MPSEGRARRAIASVPLGSSYHSPEYRGGRSRSTTAGSGPDRRAPPPARFPLRLHPFETAAPPGGDGPRARWLRWHPHCAEPAHARTNDAG